MPGSEDFDGADSSEQSAVEGLARVHKTWNRRLVMVNRDDVIRAAAVEAQAAITRALQSMRTEEIAGTGFDQAGIENGLQIIEKYLDANEIGCAVEHLTYMLDETRASISPVTFAAIVELCSELDVRAPRDLVKGPETPPQVKKDDRS